MQSATTWKQYLPYNLYRNMNKLFTSRNESNNWIFCCFRWFNVSPIEDGCLTTPDRTEGRRFALPEASWCSNTWRSAQLFLSALWPVSNWRESSLQDQLKGRGCPSDTRKSSEPMAVRNSSCPSIWNYYLGPVERFNFYLFEIFNIFHPDSRAWGYP